MSSPEPTTMLLTGACFSLGWVEGVLIQLVYIAAAIMIMRLLLPWLFGLIGFDTGPLMRVVEIVIWVVVAVFAIRIVFSLLACLLGSG